MATKAKITYATAHRTTDPIKQVRVSNSAGYLDLVLSKNANGKAVRIANKFNEQRVFVALNEIDSLIDGLKLVKAQGVKLSVEDVTYDRNRG